MNKIKTFFHLTIVLFIFSSKAFSQEKGEHVKLKKVEHTSKEASMSGYIEFELEGLVSDYDYYWSTGAKGLILEGMPSGEYTFYIKDKYSCGSSYEVKLLELDTKEVVIKHNIVVERGMEVIEVLASYEGEELMSESFNVKWSDGEEGNRRKLLGRGLVETNVSELCYTVSFGEGKEKSKNGGCVSIGGEESLVSEIIEEYREEVQAYPNPFENDLKLAIYSLEKGLGLIELRTISGQLLFDKSINLGKGKNEEILNLGDKLEGGIYIVKVRLPSKKEVYKKVIHINRG